MLLSPLTDRRPCIEFVRSDSAEQPLRHPPQPMDRPLAEAGDQIAALLVDQQQWLAATEQQQQVLEELSGQLTVRYFNDADVASCLTYEDEQMLNSSDILLLRSDEKESLRDLTSRLQQTIKDQKLKRIILMPANDTNEVSIERLKELATLVNLLAI